MNSVNLFGRLTRDPELKTTKTGKFVTNFTVAVDKYTKDENGDTADFIACVAYGQRAEFLCNYAAKGQQVAVNGRLNTRSYENKDGQTVHVTEVIVNDLQIVRKPRYNDSIVPQEGAGTGTINTAVDKKMNVETAVPDALKAMNQAQQPKQEQAKEAEDPYENLPF